MEWWILDLAKIMLINLVLSGDNAVVIAMASRNLPIALQRLAVFWGAAMAVILRVILTIIAFKLLEIPYLMAAGAILLLWVAMSLLLDSKQMDHDSIKASDMLLNVVMTIVLADFVMSLDNVIAIAAVAEGDVILITLGLLFSIPLIIWGSHLVLKLLERYPLFLYLGAAVLAYTAGEMILKDQKAAHWVVSIWPFSEALIPAFLALVVAAVGYISKKSKIYC